MNIMNGRKGISLINGKWIKERWKEAPSHHTRKSNPKKLRAHLHAQIISFILTSLLFLIWNSFYNEFLGIHFRAAKLALMCVFSDHGLFKIRVWEIINRCDCTSRVVDRDLFSTENWALHGSILLSIYTHLCLVFS